MASLASVLVGDTQSLLDGLNELDPLITSRLEAQSRLSQVRGMLQQVGRNSAGTQLKRPSLSWFDTMTSALEEKELYSVMGLGLSVVALIFKHTEAETQGSYEEEGVAFDGVVRCLQAVDEAILTSDVLDVNTLMDAKGGSESFKTLMLANIVIHQCIEVLEEVVAGAGENRKSPLSRMVPSSHAVFSLLGKARRWQEESNGLLGKNEKAHELLGRLEVDICKLVAMAAEWTREYGGTESLLLEAPQAILTIAIYSAVVHDCFLTAFQLVCETARQRLPRDEVQRKLCSVLVGAWGYLQRDVAALLSDDSYLLTVKRVEGVATMIGMIFEDNEKPTDVGVDVDGEEETPEGIREGGAVATSLQCLVGLQSSLKDVYATAKNDSRMKAEQRADLRQACSGCRRACITAAIVILSSRYPLSGSSGHSGVEWVMQSIAEPSGAFWSLCLLPQQLSSPLFLPVAYRALATIARPGEGEGEGEVEAGEEREDGMDILLYELRRALKKTTSYSLEAAKDVLLAVNELCEKGCTELFRQGEEEEEDDEDEDGGSVAQAVLLAYETNRQSCQANIEWKIHAALALRSLLHLLSTSQSLGSEGSSLSSSFCERALGVMAMDTAWLYSAVLPAEILQGMTLGSFTVPSEQEVSARLGLSGGEGQASVLHTLTQTTLKCLDCLLSFSADQGEGTTTTTSATTTTSTTESVQVLAEVLRKAAGRTLVFEDDRWQASMEPALVGKLALFLRFRSPPSTETGIGNAHQLLISDAVDTMCVQAGLRARVVPSSSSSAEACSGTDICFVYAREQILTLAEALIPHNEVQEGGANPLLRELNSSLPLSLEEVSGDRGAVAAKVAALFVQI